MKTGNTPPPRRSSHEHSTTPQWSPVMKTGNTCGAARWARPFLVASMEPGHEDREYTVAQLKAVSQDAGLNGARS